MRNSRFIWTLGALALGAIVFASTKQGMNLAQQVLVVNSASQAVPTYLNNTYSKPLPTDTDYPARTQLNFTYSITSYSGAGVGYTQVYIVPKGYIFVVDRFSASGYGSDTVSLPTEYDLQEFGGGSLLIDQFVAQVDSPAASPSALVNPTASGMAVPGGAALYVFAQTAGFPDGSSIALVSVRGHLIPEGVNVEFADVAGDQSQSSGLTLQEALARIESRRRAMKPR